MEVLRKIIRETLEEIFISEAHPSFHYDERIVGRLKSEYNTEPKFDFSTVADSLEILKKINFDNNKAYAIFMRSYNTTYKSKEPETGYVSVGSDLWVLVKENTIITIMFRRKDQRNTYPSGYNLGINMKTLEKFYNESEKDENGEVDFNPGKLKSKKQKQGQRKVVSLDLPKVEIDGKVWYIDEKNERLIYSKNINKTKDMDDLEEYELERVIDAVSI